MGESSTDAGGSLERALAALVARGAITEAQRLEILDEVPRHAGSAAAAPGGPGPRPRRSWPELLVEVGAYLGSALVLAALFAIVAQIWGELTRFGQTGVLLTIAGVTAATGWWASRGAAAGSARRRLAGVLLTSTAVTGGWAIANGLGSAFNDASWIDVVALAAALGILIAAQRLAASAVTEIGLFVTATWLLFATAEWLQPAANIRLDEYGYEYVDTSTYDALVQAGGVVFGMLWAGVVARRLMHQELAVALAAGFAWICANALAGSQDSRPIGLVALGLLAVLGFWRFLSEHRWPWLVLAILSVTGFVFWLVGVNQTPTLAFLVTGLVLLGSSAAGWRISRRRPGPAPQELPPAPG